MTLWVHNHIWFWA